jgi:hypothetical protein
MVDRVVEALDLPALLVVLEIHHLRTQVRVTTAALVRVDTLAVAVALMR